MLCDERSRWSSRGRIRAGSRFALLPIALLSAACSGSLPKPPSGPVPRDAFTDEVPYPPPAARVEVIPKRPNERAVWIDGQWEWDGKTWKWLSGRWMLPPPGAYFTPWTAVRRPDGRLFFARATWRSRDGKPLDFGFGHDVCPPGTTAPRASEVAGQ